MEDRKGQLHAVNELAVHKLQTYLHWLLHTFYTSKYYYVIALGQRPTWSRVSI